jgi:hypothetical protein
MNDHNKLYLPHKNYRFSAATARVYAELFWDSPKL